MHGMHADKRFMTSLLQQLPQPGQRRMRLNPSVRVSSDGLAPGELALTVAC